MSKQDSRYPYTYACDYLRSFGGADSHGVKMSRCDASQVREAVATAIGMEDEELAKKLADYYLKNEDEVSQRGMRDVMQALGIPGFNA